MIDPFLDWARTHGKAYQTRSEFAKRRSIFEKNYNDILEHNAQFEAGEVTWSRKVTEYSDLTPQEFATLRLKTRQDVEAVQPFPQSLFLTHVFGNKGVQCLMIYLNSTSWIVPTTTMSMIMKVLGELGLVMVHGLLLSLTGLKLAQMDTHRQKVLTHMK